MIQILVAISIICVFALVWVTLAIARHISASRHIEGWHSDDLPSIVPHIIPIQQPQITQQTVPVFQRELIAATQVDVQVRRSELHQSVREISANKSWTMPLKPLKHRLLTREPVLRTTVTTGETDTNSKQSQTSRRGQLRRLDPAYFNKDYGDLTDPYESQRAGTITLSQRTKRNRR
jgi:hypothetical protein